VTGCAARRSSGCCPTSTAERALVHLRSLAAYQLVEGRGVLSGYSVATMLDAPARHG